MNLLLHLVVADRIGRFLHLARGVLLVAPHVAGHLVELLFQLAELGLQLILSLGQLGRLLASVGAALSKLPHFVRDVALFLGKLVSLLLRVLHVTGATRALLLLEPALRVLDLSQRRTGLASAAGAGGCSAPHGVRGLPHLLGRLRQVRAVALA